MAGNQPWTPLLWDSLDPPPAIASTYGDIVLIAYTKGSGGDPISVTADGWTPGIASGVMAGPQLLWRQDTGAGMAFSPVITNPSSVEIRWAAIRIEGVNREVGNVRHARAVPPGSWDFYPVSVEDNETLLAFIRLAQVDVGAAVLCQITGNLLTAPTFDGYTDPIASIVRTLTPGTDFAPLQPLSDFSTGLSGNLFARTQTVLFIATWGPPLGAGLARIRSHLSEDAGSIFQATQAVAVEADVSEAFPYEVAPPPVRPFSEALTPEQVALVYYPLPTRNQEMLTTVEGETNLGRMAGTYPTRIMLRAEDVPGWAGDPITAQAAVQHIFDRWTSEFPWFVAEPVPDLRLLVPEAVASPRQHYIDVPTAGLVTTEAIAIPQDVESRRTMRDLVDEWLSIFPGTIIRQNSAGRIELVPRVGPDAPETPLELAWRDILRISDGEDDPRGVINRARVVSQGWRYEPDVPLTAPLFAVLTDPTSGLARSVLEEEDVLPDATEVLPWQFHGWDAMVSSDSDVDFDVTVTAYGAQNRLAGGVSFAPHGTTSVSFSLPRGNMQLVTLNHTARGLAVTFQAVIEHSSSGGVVITPYTMIPWRDNVFGRTYLAYVVEVTSATGEAWVQSNQTFTGEFGIPGNPEHTLPAEGGGDAVAASRALFGERLATINSSQFQLTPEQAQAVARAHVLFNINPRTIRDVQQSEWNKYPVRFDHVGRLVDLPNGEIAVVENRDYGDSFSATSGMMQSSFTAAVTEVVIDTTTPWLLLDDGDYLHLDDGSQVELS